ncbi:MAG: sigma-54 dependent transcriptional regulator [Pseudomonadota bacterium]
MVAVRTILLVEDDDSNRASVAQILEKEGYRVSEAKDGLKAMELLRKEGFDLVLTDFVMPGMDGMELLRASRMLKPDLDVVLMTAHGTIESAVEAIKEGAYDFIPKPFKRATLVRVIQKVLEKRDLQEENIRLRHELERYQARNEILGQSDATKHVLDMISQVAPSSATVLIHGESGTGKELVAEAIHRQSPRSRGPFVKVSCAAIPETLLEAELFGYEKGAFTGAIARKEGRFELANGGTLFLDEVGEISPAVQVKLLRVLQEGEFERLGATKTSRCDVRILAASNRNLEEEVREKRFREDLYYRLNVVTIPIPPLRARPADIPILLDHFLKVYAAKNKKALTGFNDGAMKRLTTYVWPGNVRELENTVERAVVLCKTRELTLDDLPESIRTGPVAEGDRIPIPIGMPLEEVEKILIRETLKRADGDKTLAAKLLGVAPRTIYRKLEET